MGRVFWILMYFFTRKGHLVFLFPLFFLPSCLYFDHCQTGVEDLHYAHSSSCYSDFFQDHLQPKKNETFQGYFLIFPPSFHTKQTWECTPIPTEFWQLTHRWGHQHPQSETVLCVVNRLISCDITWIFLVSLTLSYWGTRDLEKHMSWKTIQREESHVHSFIWFQGVPKPWSPLVNFQIKLPFFDYPGLFFYPTKVFWWV